MERSGAGTAAGWRAILVAAGVACVATTACGAGTGDDGSAGWGGGDEGGDGAGAFADGVGGDPGGEADASADGDASGLPANAPRRDPACRDGAWTETFPDAKASIQSQVNGYVPAKFKEFAMGVLDARWPTGAALMRKARELKGDCFDQYLPNRDTAGAVLHDLAGAVHECGHVLDTSESGNMDHVFYVTADRRVQCERGGSRVANGVTFARSLINGDPYSALRRPCAQVSSSPPPDCDAYGPLYLNGDPNDGGFDSGDQGYDMLLEETAQYVNSLAGSWMLSDQGYGTRTSARDGILTFLWYVERYIRLARLQYPQAYALILGRDDPKTGRVNGPCWRQLTLDLWGRAWAYLDATASIGSLGIEDARLMQLVTEPDLLAEIELVRQAEGCN